MRTNGVFLLVLLTFIGACRQRQSASKVKLDTSSMKGFILPGKGFNISTNDVTSAICVSSDKNAASTDDRSSSSPSSLKDAANESTASTGASEKDSDSNAVQLSLNETDNNNIGDIAIEFAAERPEGLGLAEIGGGTNIILYYLNSTRDVAAAIDATYANNASASMNKKKISGEIASNFEAQLNTKFQNSSENVFILMHGRKEFPAKSSNAIVNAYFNNKHRNVVFGGKDLPRDAKGMAESWRRMVGTCGDHFVEYTVQGREIWMVAVMNKKTFEASMGGSVNYGAKTGAKFGDTASASNEMKAGIKSTNSAKFMNQTMDVFIRARGRNQTEGGKLTLEASLAEMNKFLTAEESKDEAVLSIGIKNYDSVTFSFDKNFEKRGGDIFTREVREAARMNSDVFAKLLAEEIWASKEADRIFATYGWEQWSLDPRFHNGVAAQYKSLKTYLRKISDAFQYCGGRTADYKEVSQDCISMANAVAGQGRPALNLPEPYPQTINLWMPPATLAAADMKNWGNGSGEVTFDEAKRGCSTGNQPGWTIPGQDDWKRVLDASYFYTKWMKDQNPGYKADEDQTLLSYPCGRFKGATFWSDRAGSVVQMNHTCDSSQIQDLDVPSSQKYTSWIFWTKEKSRYACVKYHAK